MKFNPRPYQSLIIDHILRTPRAAVWAGMGTGKTVSTLMAVNLIRELEDPSPVLIIAPHRVAASTWPDEVRKWDELQGLSCVNLSGSPDRRSRLLDPIPDIVTVSYDLLPWLVEHFGADAWPFATVVADEATRLKSFRTRSGGRRAASLASVVRAGRVSRFIELTGTPAPNGLLDLWGQVWFLDGGERLGKSMRQYQETYFRPMRVGANAFAVRWIPLPWTQEAVQKKVDDLVVKINAEDWFDLKAPIVSRVEAPLSPTAAKHYRALERDMLVELGDDVIDAPNAAALTGKCLQLAGGAIYAADAADAEHADKAFRERNSICEGFYDLDQGKIEALRSIVAEAGGAPVLVSYQFKHEARRILEAFKEARLLDKDPETIRAWNRGEIPMLLAHPASCGHGLNLQDGGNILVFYSTGWNLEEHDQIIERIGPTRQKQAGHERPVWIYYLVAPGTLDETVLKRIKTKREVIDLLMEKKKCLSA